MRKRVSLPLRRTIENVQKCKCKKDVYRFFKGIQYRIVNDKDPGKPSAFGRVEIALNKVWGTICDASWDNNDARVLCRDKGYHDGFAIKEAFYGEGKVSPIWLSHLKCTGEETSLHKCAHRGFNSAIVDGTIGWWKCKSHKDDAGVYCINDCKLIACIILSFIKKFHNVQTLNICFMRKVKLKQSRYKFIDMCT